MKSDNLKIRHINTIEEFEALQSQWNKLLTNSSKKTVFLTWEWLSTWWKYYQDDRELWLITAWSENELIGAAPLMKTTQRRFGFRLRIIQSLGSPNCDESDFITYGNNVEALQKLCDYIHSQRAQWDALEISELKVGDSSKDFIQEYFSAKGCVIREKINSHYYIPITESWEGYWKKLSKNLRHNIERRLRRVEEQHQVKFQMIQGRDLSWNDFETIFSVSTKGNYPEKYQSKEERSIHRDLMEKMRTQNWLRIAILWFDEVAVAFDYGFAIDGRFEDWRTGFDLGYADWAGGTLLLYFQLKSLFTDKYQELDFLRGEYDYKDKWVPSKRDFTELRIIPSHKLLARVVLVWGPSLWHWAKAKIKRANSKK